ncbi:MAG: tetratricopeptide repeat protein [Bacteroidota bacterium]
MAKKDKKAAGPGEEFYENPEVLAEKLSKTEELLEKNKNVVFGVLVLIALIVAGFFGFNYYKENQNNIAQTEMFQAVYYFEADSLNKALNGDGNSYGFLDIIDNFGLTKAANLSQFYAGASYLKLGNYEEAIEHLKSFDSDDIVLQARAYALAGDSYMELGNYYDAIEMYEKAANYKSNEFFSPIYLKKAAIAYEKLNDFEGALKCYTSIVEDYSKSREAVDAKKHKARLENLAS